MLLLRQLRCLGHIIRMPESRLPHCVLYGETKTRPQECWWGKKRFRDHIKSILKSATFHLTGWKLSHPTETWLSTCAIGMSCFDAEYDQAAGLRHQHTVVLLPIPDFFINAHFVADNASHALASSATVKPTFNDEEEVVVIHNGRTPKKKNPYFSSQPTPKIARLTSDYIESHAREL